MIDLRSDTVTQPCENMRKAMAEASVGDDVFGEDPTVNRLQDMVADMLGKEAALYVPTGTQANLVTLLTQCERGEEYIVGQTAHTYKYEAGGAAVLGSIQPQPVEFEADGTLDLDKLQQCVKPDDPHFAITKLLCLENTVGGKILPMEYLPKAREFADRNNLLMHLDGARLFNAAVALGVDVKDIAQHFDTVSVCLSKGLGAPMGSLITGRRETIMQAVRWRKMLGGGLRQCGIVAAAGIYALGNNIERLEEDHDNAKYLAQSLAHIEALGIDMGEVQTNMVFINAPETGADKLVYFMAKKNIKISGGKRIRLTIHLDVSRQDVGAIIGAFNEFYETGNALSACA